MRRFVICITLLVLIFSLSVSVSAATQAKSVATYATVTSDESCDVTMTVTLHLDDPLSKLSFPVPNKANNITLNGSRVSSSASGGVRTIDLSKVTGGMPGDFTAVITFHLNDVVSLNEEGFLVLEVPLLSGFDYPVSQLECSVLLPGEVVTKPSFSSGYHNTNIEQYLTTSVTGATITCATTHELKDHETLTMSTHVTDAMFPQSVIRVQDLSSLYILMGVCAGIALAYWLVFLRNVPPLFRSVSAPPFAALESCDIGGKMLRIFRIFHKVCNSTGFREKSEHLFVICGVAEIDHAFFRIFNAVMFFEIKKAHGEFVVISEPGVDMDGTDISFCTDFFYGIKNLFCFFKSKFIVFVFCIVESKIVETAVLVDADFYLRIFCKGNFAYFFVNGISVLRNGRMNKFFS